MKRHLKIILIFPSILFLFTFAQTSFFSLNNQGFPLSFNFDADTSGNLIVVFEDWRDCIDYGGIEEGASIYIQKFDINGSLIGDMIRIDEKDTISQSNSNPDIDVNITTNNRVIVWQQYYDRDSTWSSKSRIFASIFDQNMEKINYQFVISEIDSIAQVFPQVKYLSNNNILYTWFENDNHEMSYFAKITDSFGNTICDRYKITFNGLDETLVYFDTTPKGYYFIWDNYIQFYDNLGNPTSDIIVLPFQRILATKYLLSNKVLFVHGNNIDGLYKTSTFQYPANNISESIILVDDTTLNSKGSFDIAENSTGNIIITWTDRRNDYYSEGWGTSIYSVYDVYGQRLDSSLNLIDSNFKINHETDELEQNWPIVQFIDDTFICIYLQHDYNILEGTGRWYIAGSSQDFYSPTPGRVYGWKYLFDFVPIVENPYPNPLVHSTQNFATIKFEIDSVSNVFYDIYNIYGQRIKSSKSKTYSKGPSYLYWNGLTDFGELASSGIYIWLVNIDNQYHAKKITVLK